MRAARRASCQRENPGGGYRGFRSGRSTWGDSIALDSKQQRALIVPILVSDIADRRRADAAHLFLAAMITRGIESLRTLRWRGQSGANPSLLSDFRWIEVQKKSRCNSIVYLATGVLSVRRSGDREFADSLLEGSGFEPRGDPFSGVRRGRFPPNLAGSVPVAMLEEQIYLHAI